MKRRFAVTHKTNAGLWVCTFGNQGRYHYDTKEAAEEARKLFEPSLRAKVLGDLADSLRVVEVDCYDHGDCVASILNRFVEGETPLPETPLLQKAQGLVADKGCHPDGWC